MILTFSIATLIVFIALIYQLISLHRITKIDREEINDLLKEANIKD